MKNKYSSKNLIEKKKRRKKMIFNLILFAIFGVLIGIVFLLNADFWRISNLEINDLKYINKQEVEENFYQEISDKYFMLINKSNSVFYPKYEIERGLIEKYNAIDYINIKRLNLKTIELEIKEFDMYAKFCKDAESLEEASDTKKCYLLNRNGDIYSDYQSEDIFIEFSGLLNDPKIGDGYLSVEDFKKIILLIDYLKEIDFNTNSVYSEDGESFELTLNTGLKLLYEKNDEPKQVVENLNLLLTNEAFVTDLNDIAYIDLRFDKNIYFKEKKDMVSGKTYPNIIEEENIIEAVEEILEEEVGEVVEE